MDCKLGGLILLLLAACSESKPPPEAPRPPMVIGQNDIWKCSDTPYCPEIRGCAEANYRANVCGLSRLDADGDGYACELTCKGSGDYKDTASYRAHTAATEATSAARTSSVAATSAQADTANPYMALAPTASQGAQAPLDDRWKDDPIVVPAPETPATFRGYPCVGDCSGHRAGYEWAEENEITDSDQCSEKSESFYEGCLVRVEESVD